MTEHSPLAAAAEAYFRELHAHLIAQFQRLEPAPFALTPWRKPEGGMLQGGGTMALARGKVFEKVGINISCVHGTFSEKFRKEIPGAEDSGGKFWAAGVSLVCHPANPHVPAVHFNVRRIETAKGWFGGGADLTPSHPYTDDTAHFHATLKAACDSYAPTAYPTYKQWCDDYFFLPHYNEPRGVGGIFYDYLEDRPADTFAFTKAVAEAFQQAYLPLVEKRMAQPFTAEDRQAQGLKRSRYAEFNLLYDRGTRFGFQSGGNPQAILMSMPPTTSW